LFEEFAAGAEINVLRRNIANQKCILGNSR
jgi:hypothetical protein